MKMPATSSITAGDAPAASNLPTWSVTNLFDRIGQEYYGYIHPSSINDALGRCYALTVRRAF